VLYIHGVEADNDRFAETSIALLKKEFTRAAGVDAEQALVVHTAFWGAVFQERQNELLRRVGAQPALSAFTVLDRLAAWAGRGYSMALLPAAATIAARWLPGAPGFHYPTLRWLVTHYLGDAITYEARPSDRELYDRVHQIVAAALHELAEEAGENAPLCIIAHSLGSVVISNFMWDLQVAAGVHPRRAGHEPVAEHVAAELGDTPLERGETLAWLYTLGSPLALWSQRYDEFGEPVAVPSRSWPPTTRAWRANGSTCGRLTTSSRCRCATSTRPGRRWSAKTAGCRCRPAGWAGPPRCTRSTGTTPP